MKRRTKISIIVIGAFCYFVIGFMLFFKYNNSLKGLGIIFVVFIIITSIIGLFVTEFLAVFIFFTYLIYYYAFKECLTKADNDPDGSSVSHQ